MTSNLFFVQSVSPQSLAKSNSILIKQMFEVLWWNILFKAMFYIKNNIM